MHNLLKKIQDYLFGQTLPNLAPWLSGWPKRQIPIDF